MLGVLNALENFREQRKALHYKTHLCINQCPKNGIGFAKKKAQKLETPLIQIFPFDEESVWKQVFEAVPVVVQRKTSLAKSIGKFSLKLNDL